MTRRSIRAWSGPKGLPLLVALLAGCTSGSPGDPSVQSAATATLAPAPTVAVSPGDGFAFHVELVHALQNEVTVDVVDESGTLVEASSGTPGDGASVEPYTVAVSNDDASTVRLTWVGGPCDSASTLMIDATARQFLLVQPECSGDATASDRILVLRFSAPVDAGAVQASLQDGLDTPG